MNCNELKAARIRRGVPQKDMANEVGVTQAQYNRIENGKSRVTVERAEKITQILKLTKAEKEAIFF